MRLKHILRDSDVSNLNYLLFHSTLVQVNSSIHLYLHLAQLLSNNIPWTSSHLSLLSTQWHGYYTIDIWKCRSKYMLLLQLFSRADVWLLFFRPTNQTIIGLKYFVTTYCLLDFAFGEILYRDLYFGTRYC